MKNNARNQAEKKPCHQHQRKMAIGLLLELILAGFLLFTNTKLTSAKIPDPDAKPVPDSISGGFPASKETAKPTGGVASGQNQKPPDAESFSVGKYLTTNESSDKDTKSQGKQEQSYLKSSNPVASFIVQIINFLVLTIGSFSFLTVIIGGFTLLTAHGNENQITKGKDILKYAITGLVVALSAYFITAFVQSLFYELPR